MSNSKARTAKSKGKSKCDNFIWTDDEVELLLNVVAEYKVKRTAENVDWESCVSKYSDIVDMFLAQYPSPENAELIGKDFPHNKNELNKTILATKLKSIRLKFRSAVDSGKKSGHGRVVLLYFELCQRIWGGSPATTTLPSGIESNDIHNEFTLCILNSPSSSSRPSSPSSRHGTSSSSITELDGDEPEAEMESTQVRDSSKSNNRRDLLNARLNGYRQEKLKRKMSVESQLLNATQEDIEIKKRIIEKLDNMDKQQADHMSKLTSNMEQLTGSIVEGFAMLRHVLQHPCAMPQQFVAQPSSYLNYNRMPPRQPMHNENNSNDGFHFDRSLFPDESY